jgi:hypothetical protein
VKIIFGFKDYYDSAQSFGSDPNLRYLRAEKHFEYEERVAGRADSGNGFPKPLNEVLRLPLQVLRQLPRRLCTPRTGYHTMRVEVPVTVKLIGFCGALYPALEIADTIFYSTERLAEELPEEFLRRFALRRRDLESVLEVKEKRSGQTSYWRPALLTHQHWNDAAADLAQRRFDDAFVDLGVPIFKLEYEASDEPWLAPNKVRCSLNPALRNEHFQKIKGPAEAFQEISMYLGNQLARQPDPIPNIPDEIMRDEKGFDKWSFRRHKEEDTKHRKRKRPRA